ncbi:hypothetical protein CC79DRAFT_1327391 [Sarocladium strictum]
MMGATIKVLGKVTLPSFSGCLLLAPGIFGNGIVMHQRHFLSFETPPPRGRLQAAATSATHLPSDAR